MALQEVLRLVVDADTRGAVQGIEHLGRTADRELSRSEQSLDRWGNRLTTVGASLVGIGSVALVGLGAAAMASEEANLATVKLENTLKNMPKLAGESSKQFVDLAESIQSVTAADADAIVEAEALLGTFNLTAQEIKGITPLIVDYARKFGVDIPDAAVQVGKALDGQVGALKRNGVSIDEAAFAVDRYSAVQKALSEQVGGFAEAEGKTFAGSLQRMKNELGDLAEGVGSGAVDAFTKLFGVVDGLTGRLNELSPETLSTIGTVATFGSVGLIAAGGISVLIGQIIKMRDNFVIAREAVASFAGSGGLGRLGQATLVIGGLVALRAALEALDDDLKGVDVSTLENELLDLAQTGAIAGEQLSAVFTDLGDALKSGDPDELEGIADRLGKVDEALAQLAGRDPQAAAASFREINKALLEQGATGDQVKGFFDDYAAAVTNADTAARTGTGGVDGLSGAMGEQAGTTGEATSALEEYSNALQAQFDPLFGAVDASHQLAEANQKVAEAEVAVAEATSAHGAGSVEATAAQQALTLAQLDASSAALGQESALIELADAVGNGTVSLQGAKQKLAEWVAQGVITQASADATAAKFDEVTGSALAIPGSVSTTVFANTHSARLDIAGVGQQLNDIDGRSATVTVNARTVWSTIGQAFGFLGGRQHGGPVDESMPYLVGEEGPELFMPAVNGRVLSHADSMRWLSMRRLASGGPVRARTWDYYNKDGQPWAEIFATGQHIPLPVRGEDTAYEWLIANGYLSASAQDLARIARTGTGYLASVGYSAPAARWDGGGDYTYAPNIVINTGADPQAVVEAIKRYERSNGSGWRT